jgi:phenylalanyl-tRNA synthetase beta chain
LVQPDPVLTWEEEFKVRLRDWGYTEVYTYSMISEELMDIFGLDKKNVYQISNPLSSEWVYMRPNLIPSVLSTIAQNLHARSQMQIFELSNAYMYKSKNLPAEVPFLTVAWAQDQIRVAKGLAQALFLLLGTPFPSYVFETPKLNWWHPAKYLRLGDYGQLGLIHPALASELKIKMPVTVLELNFTKLVVEAKTEKKYLPIPKHPGVIEDVSFTFPPQTAIGPVLDRIKKLAPQIYSVELINQYEQTSTFKIMYLDLQKVLTAVDIEKLRTLLIMTIQHEFAAKIKGNF